jgi:EmrB/QacA subfamily drug resistance transporter
MSMSEGQKRLALIGCLITILLAILDQNIVSTASVVIVRDLDPVDGLARLPWLITVYALAATAALPLYGKLCDVYGAKYVYLGAIATFLAGSALCGAAQSMTWLIGCRAVQGLGGGGLMSVTMVVMAHLAPPEERAEKGGMGGIVAGLGLVIGPLIGGLFADHLGWRWIFYVNLPFGLFVLLTGAKALRLGDGGERHRIDYLGALLIGAASIALLLICQWGGRDHAWGSPTILGLVAAAVLLIAGLVARQLTAAEPILPRGLFRNVTTRLALPLQFLSGFGGFGGPIVYTMIYLQSARGVTAANAGLYLIPMALGMTVSGLVAGRLAARGAGIKGFLVAGTAISALAIGLLALLRPGTTTAELCAILFLLGTGLGQVVGLVIMIVQNAVPVTLLGAATTAIRFAQTLGSAFGTAVLGVILTRVVSAAHVTTTDATTLAALPPGERHRVVDALVSGVDVVFAAASGVMLVAVVLTALLKVRQARQAAPEAAVAIGS